MFSAALGAYQAYLDSLKATGLDLEGVQTVQTGDQDVPAVDMPVVTMDWDGAVDYVDNGNHLDITARFCFLTYISSLEDDATQEATLRDLLFRWDPVAKIWRGIIPALKRKRGIQDPISGQNFICKVQKRILVGKVISKKQKHYSLGAAIDVNVQTFFDPEQFGP